MQAHSCSGAFHCKGWLYFVPDRFVIVCDISHRLFLDKCPNRRDQFSVVAHNFINAPSTVVVCGQKQNDGGVGPHFLHADSESIYVVDRRRENYKVDGLTTEGLQNLTVLSRRGHNHEILSL